MNIQPIGISRGYSVTKQTSNANPITKNHSQPVFGMKKVSRIKSLILLPLILFSHACESKSDRIVRSLYSNGENGQLSEVVSKLGNEVAENTKNIIEAVEKKRPEELVYDVNFYKTSDLENEYMVNVIDSTLKKSGEMESRYELYRNEGLNGFIIDDKYEKSNTPFKTFMKKTTALFQEYSQK